MLETDTDAAEYIDPSEEEAEATEAAEAAAAAAAAAADKGGDKDKDKGKDKDGDIRAELAGLRARLTEAESATRYWHEQAKGAKPADKAADKTEDKPLSVDLVEAISTGNKKAIATALGEMGFVDRGTMNAHINAARQQGMTEATIMREYPDLADNNSDFFKATQKHFQELVTDGADANSLLTTKMAARLAKADVAQEAGRGDRIRRQAGDRGARPSSRGRDGGGDELDAQQKSIIASFQRAGAAISEESYKKRAQAGVSMSGVRTRRS